MLHQHQSKHFTPYAVLNHACAIRSIRSMFYGVKACQLGFKCSKNVIVVKIRKDFTGVTEKIHVIYRNSRNIMTYHD